MTLGSLYAARLVLLEPLAHLGDDNYRVIHRCVELIALVSGHPVIGRDDQPIEVTHMPTLLPTADTLEHRMNFDAGTRTRILVDVTLGIDPTASTVELRVDSTWYPAAWLATAETTTVQGRPAWTQTARTTGYFAGPDAVASGATVLTLGRHPLEVRVTSGQDVLTFNVGSVSVVS